MARMAPPYSGSTPSAAVGMVFTGSRNCWSFYEEGIFLTHNSLELIKLTPAIPVSLSQNTWNSCCWLGQLFHPLTSQLFCKRMARNLPTCEIMCSQGTNLLMEGHMIQFSARSEMTNFGLHARKIHHLPSGLPTLFISADDIFQMLCVSVTDWNERFGEFYHLDHGQQ